jgi:hypothetical protein
MNEAAAAVGCVSVHGHDAFLQKEYFMNSFDNNNIEKGKKKLAEASFLWGL